MHSIPKAVLEFFDDLPDGSGEWTIVRGEETHDVEFDGLCRGEVYDLEFLRLCEGEGRKVADELGYGMVGLA